MTNRIRGRWLLVGLAIGVLVIALPVVSAHGGEPTQHNETQADGTPTDAETTEWAAWMEGNVTDHMGPEAVAEMQAHMRTFDREIPRGMTPNSQTAAGMGGQGHGC